MDQDQKNTQMSEKAGIHLYGQLLEHISEMPMWRNWIAHQPSKLGVLSSSLSLGFNFCLFFFGSYLCSWNKIGFFLAFLFFTYLFLLFLFLIQAYTFLKSTSMAESICENKSSELFLGFDCSTQSLKCTVVDRNMKVVYSNGINYDKELSRFNISNGIVKGEDGSITTPTLLVLPFLLCSFHSGLPLTIFS